MDQLKNKSKSEKSTVHTKAKGVKSLEEEEDRISRLPDALLQHILSFLPSTVDAIRTCFVSKRWQNLWTHLPNLIFNVHCGCKFPDVICGGKFADLIDKTLALYSSSKLKKFHIVYNTVVLSEFSSRIEPWLRFAVGREVEDLILDFYYEGNETEYYTNFNGYKLPQFLYQCSSLRSLNTTYCQFVPDGRLSWASLQFLRIGYAALNDQLIQKILDGTPALQFLELNFFFGIEKLELSLNSHLETLVIQADESYFLIQREAYVIEILGPNLKFLEILGAFAVHCKLVNMSSLVSARIDFAMVWGIDCQNKVRRTLEAVRHAKQLIVGDWCIEVLSASTTGTVSPSLKCNCLVLYVSSFDNRYLHGTATLLRSSHKLEKLVINLCDGVAPDLGGYREVEDYIPDSPDAGENYWTYMENFSCLSCHLKTIEIFGFRERGNVHGNLFAFLKYLLKSALVLQKMTIRNSSPTYEMREELLSFPRSSPHAVVLFN